MIQRLATLAALAASAAAHAHPGHGLRAESHWHATDTVGLLVVVVLVAGAAYWAKRRK